MKTKNIVRPRKIIELCINIFTQNENRPLYVGDIYNRMKQRHWKTNGKTPTQTISAKLRSDNRFKKVAPNTFTLDDGFFVARKRNYNS